MWHDKFCLGTSRVSGGLQRDRKPPSRAAEAQVHLTAHSNRGHKTCWLQTSVISKADAPSGRRCSVVELLLT